MCFSVQFINSINLLNYKSIAPWSVVGIPNLEPLCLPDDVVDDPRVEPGQVHVYPWHLATPQAPTDHTHLDQDLSVPTWQGTHQRPASVSSAGDSAGRILQYKLNIGFIAERNW